MIVGLISTALGALLWAYSTFALSAEFDAFKGYTNQQFVELRIEQIVEQLNQITRREKLGISSKYDEIRKEELEREWQRLKEVKERAN